MDELKELKDKSDHDLLVITVVKLDNVIKVLGNHLAHCNRREMIYLTIILGCAATSVISLIGLLNVLGRGV